ncbi:MAG: ATP-binding protein [Gemmatimonas sp.]
MRADAVSQTLTPSENSSRARGFRSLGLVLAAAVVACGGVALFASALGWTRVLAPSDSWPALTQLGAVELILLGVAFAALLRGNRRITLPLAGFATATSLLCFIGSMGAYTLPLGGLALSSALLHTTIAFAILIATASGSARDEERALGVAGFVLVTMVLTMLGAVAIGVLSPMSDSTVAGASLQTLVLALALGVYLLVDLWTSGRVTLDSADWLPAGAGFASMLTVIVLWRGLYVQEGDQLTALMRQAGVAQSRAMQESIRVLALSLSRAAQWRARGASPEQQAGDLESLRRDIQGLEGGTYFSIDYGHIGLGPTDVSTPSLDTIWRTRVATPGVLPDSIQYWPLDTLSAQFAVVAPSCGTNGHCEGAIIGIMQTEELFQSIVSDTSQGFLHKIDFDGEFDSADDSSALMLASEKLVESPLHFGDVQLELETIPTRATVGRVRSKMPLVVLSMGALLSLVLVLATHLGQNARRLARTREKARLASVLERATDGVWEWDLNTGLADHSAGIWRNLGYRDAEVRGDRSRWIELVHPEDVEAFNRQLALHLSGDSDVFEHEYRVRSRSGEWHTMVDRARVVERTPAGAPSRLLGVRADVSEARNAHAARLMNERRFRAIFDSGFQYQLLLDREGQVLEVNRVALEAGNASIEHVVGQPVWNTLWWASSSEAREPLIEAFRAASGGTATRYETVVNGEGGPSSTLEVAIKPFFDSAGETNQILLEARDITVRRRAEAALQEVDTLTTMGRVAARVAHEINNPLAGIQNSFLLIKGAVPTTHPHYSYVGAIEREIDRIAAVTRQLYETYRPEPDSAAGTSVRSLVTDAVTFLLQVNRHSHVRIETDFSNVPSVIRLPSAMLRQIFINLAQNAFEASPPGELVTIRAEMTDGQFTLSVRDRGNGVPPELRDRIFDPFFSTKDRGVRTGGMGLGLALVRRTVTAAGGNIAVADAPGSGAIFTVTLPVPSGAQGDAA